MQNNIPEDLEKSLGINDLVPVDNNRSSSEELKIIKKYSDENLDIISKNLNTINEEEKRGLIVNLIAALDYYVHGIIIWEITQITLNQFPEGKKYSDIKIKIKFLKEFKKSNFFDEPEIKKEIIKEIRYNTYQKWEDIRYGLSLILPKEVNSKIGELTSGKPSPAIFQTEKLEEINEKRNLIVHHFDREYENEYVRNDFDLDCQKSFGLIKLIIDSIHKIVEDYDNTQPENSN